MPRMADRLSVVNVHAVFLKEVRTLVRSPLLYVLGAVFLGLAGYFFYTDVLYFDLLNQDKVGLTQGLWQRFFEDLRLCLLLVTPVLAARVFAEERRLGTMEMLLTYPLTEAEVVGGKFLSLVSLFVPLLAVTVLYPLALSVIWPVDPWPLVAAYLGVVLLSLACLGCGMCCSAVASQQSSAAVGAFGVLFFFWFLAWNEAAANPTLLAVLRRLSLFDRFYDFTRGTVHSRDVVYFLTVTTLCVVFSLEALRWRWQQERKKRLLRVALLLAVGVGIDDWAVRHNRTWELVREKESILSPETERALTAVQIPVHILVFYEPGRYRETLYLAEKCGRVSPLMTVTLVDLDREPARARQYNVRAYGTVVVEAAGRREVVYPAEERLLVQAIARVTDPRPRLVCVSTGHGEREVTTERRTGGEEPASLGELFARLGYRWQEVVLAQERIIPSDCRLFFAYGPRRDFGDEEVRAMVQFLAAGGRVLLLLDPVPLPRLQEWLPRYGVIPGGEVVPDDTTPLYLRDRYTLPVFDLALSARAAERFIAVLYGGRRVDFAAADDGASGGVFLGYRSPTRGLVPVGVAVEVNGARRGRLVVIGDADFLDSTLFRRESNRALLVRAFDWLEERETQQSPGGERYAYAPLSVRQARLLFWAILLPPLGFLLAGGMAWWRRKRG